MKENEPIKNPDINEALEHFFYQFGELDETKRIVLEEFFKEIMNREE